jgi:hypothetical protein
LAPATISFSDTTAKLIDGILYSEKSSPNTLALLNARNLDSLRTLAKTILPRLTGRQAALAGYLSDAECENIHVSDKTKKFWQDKKAADEILLDVFLNAEKRDDELDAEDKKKRDDYLVTAMATWEAQKNALNILNTELIGPYVLGTTVLT